MGGKLKRDGELGNGGGGGNKVWSEYIVNGSLCEAASKRKKLVLGSRITYFWHWGVTMRGDVICPLHLIMNPTPLCISTPYTHKGIDKMKDTSSLFVVVLA